MASKVKVPEEINNVARRAYGAWRTSCSPEEEYTNGAARVAQAVLQYISEHPPVPTPEQCAKMYEAFVATGGRMGDRRYGAFVAVEWFRMAYSEPESPSEIADLMWQSSEHDDVGDRHNRDMRTLYERLKGDGK